MILDTLATATLNGLYWAVSLGAFCFFLFPVFGILILILHLGASRKENHNG